MAAPVQLTDAFPKSITESKNVQQLPNLPNFQMILTESKIHPFITFLDKKEKMYYKPTPIESGRHAKHFLELGSQVAMIHSNEEQSRDWARKKLQKEVADNFRKNIDTRTSYKWKKHFFLVKSCFTFGLRTVPINLKHIYQVGVARMLLYILSPRRVHRATVFERVFVGAEQHRYHRKVLRRNTCYSIPAGVAYVLFTTHKSFFSVHIVSAEEVLPFECINPLEEPIQRSIPADYIYRRPVATPRIEDAMIDDDPPLIELDSGERITEDMLAPSQMMPPAPPPPPPFQTMPPPPSQMMPPPPPLPSQMMPPPPPPPPQMMTYHHQIINLTSIPIEKEIQIVEPNMIQWFHNLKNQEYNNPKSYLLPLGVSDETEPMDLACGPPRTIATPATAAATVITTTTTAAASIVTPTAAAPTAAPTVAAATTAADTATTALEPESILPAATATSTTAADTVTLVLEPEFILPAIATSTTAADTATLALEPITPEYEPILPEPTIVPQPLSMPELPVFTPSTSGDSRYLTGTDVIDFFSNYDCITPPKPMFDDDWDIIFN